MPLEEYKRKRNFKKSPEPPPKSGSPESALMFVVQKHSARRLHYDLRLELDGVPFRWEELERIYPADFNIINAPARLAKVGDIWANIMKDKKPSALDS